MLIKLQLNSEIHIISKFPDTFEELCLAVRNSFKDKLLDNQFSLYYIDSEQDKIFISSENDLQALKGYIESQKSTLKIYIEISNNKVIVQNDTNVSSSSNSIIESQIVNNGENQQQQNQQQEQIQVQPKEEEEEDFLLQQAIQQSLQNLKIDEEVFIQKPQQVEFKQEEQIPYLNTNFSDQQQQIFSTEPLIQQQQQEFGNEQTQIQEQLTPCRKCDGTGYNQKKNKVCKRCDGKGLFSKLKKCWMGKIQKHSKKFKKCHGGIQKLVEKQIKICLPQIKEMVLQQVMSELHQQQNVIEQVTFEELNEPQSIFSNQNQQQQQQQQQGTGQVVHSHVTCDGCQTKPIVGVRYKCSVCEDFDFCEKCEAQVKHDHPFLKIRTLSQAPLQIYTVLNEEQPPRPPNFNQGQQPQQQQQGGYHNWQVNWPFGQFQMQGGRQGFHYQGGRGGPRHCGRGQLRNFFQNLFQNFQQPQQQEQQQQNQQQQPQQQQQENFQFQQQQQTQNQATQQPEAKQNSNNNLSSKVYCQETLDKAKLVQDFMGGQGNIEDYLDVVDAYKGNDLNELILQILSDQKFIEKINKKN